MHTCMYDITFLLQKVVPPPIAIGDDQSSNLEGCVLVVCQGNNAMLCDV